MDVEVIDMVWLLIALGVGVGLLLVAAAVRRQRRSPAEGFDDVDPLFMVGVVLTGTGAALATTLGPFMFAVLAVGLVVMFVGAQRSRHQHR